MATQKLTDQAQATQIAQWMHPVLTDLLALSLNLKQAHWHVRGRQFTQIHEQLDDVVDDARRLADEVAERVVALGISVDGRPATVADKTALPEFSEGFLIDDKIIAAVVEQLDAAIRRAREAVGPLDDLDQVSQDVIIEVLRCLDKHRWMFAAQSVS